MSEKEPIGKCYKCGAYLYATLGLCLSCENEQLRERLETAEAKIEQLEKRPDKDLDMLETIMAIRAANVYTDGSHESKSIIMDDLITNLHNRWVELQTKVEQQQVKNNHLKKAIKKAKKQLCKACRPASDHCERYPCWRINVIERAEAETEELLPKEPTETVFVPRELYNQLEAEKKFLKNVVLIDVQVFDDIRDQYCNCKDLMAKIAWREKQVKQVEQTLKEPTDGE